MTYSIRSDLVKRRVIFYKTDIIFNVSGILALIPISRLEALLGIRYFRRELWAYTLPKFRVNSIFR
jgi:hypothetical protein